MYIYTYIRVYTYIYTLHIYIYINICVYICHGWYVYIYICMIYLYTYIYMWYINITYHVYAYRCIFLHVCVYIYVYIFTYICMHIYTYNRALARSAGSGWHSDNVLKLKGFYNHEPPGNRIQIAVLWVHFFFKTDIGYPKDAWVPINSPWPSLRIPFATIPLGQFTSDQSQPSPIISFLLWDRNPDSVK